LLTECDTDFKDLHGYKLIRFVFASRYNFDEKSKLLKMTERYYS